jgi:peroxiredoxin
MHKLRSLIFSLVIIMAPGIANGSAPDFNLVDMDGNTRNIGEFIGQGKWTVVVIWAEDCHVCNAEIHNYDFFHDEHKDKNVGVLGVSIDGKKKIELSRDFIKRHGLTFPNLLMEPDIKDISKFGGNRFVGTPTIYIYTPEGKIVAAQSGAVPVSVIEEFIQNWKGPANTGS